MTEYDPLDDLPIDEEVEEQTTQETVATLELRALLAQPAMRRYVWRLLHICGMSRLSYNGNEIETFLLEGRRSIGIEVLAELEIAEPLIYATMITEEYDARGQ